MKIDTIMINSKRSQITISFFMVTMKMMIDIYTYVTSYESITN